MDVFYDARLYGGWHGSEPVTVVYSIRQLHESDRIVRIKIQLSTTIRLIWLGFTHSHISGLGARSWDRSWYKLANCSSSRRTYCRHLVRRRRICDRRQDNQEDGLSCALVHLTRHLRVLCNNRGNLRPRLEGRLVKIIWRHHYGRVHHQRLCGWSLW